MSACHQPLPSTRRMRSRSSTRRSGRSSSGARLRRMRLRAFWITSPTQSSGRSANSSTAPPAITPRQTTTAIEPTRNRLRSTEAPVMRIETMLITGRPRSVAVEMSETAVTPVAAHVRADAGLAQHVELHGAAGGGAARHDAAEGVAGQLRRRDGEPRLDVERQAQQRPHAGEAGELRRDDGDAPERVDVPELRAGREDRGEARPDDVQAEPGQREHDGALDPDRLPARPAAGLSSRRSSGRSCGSG